LSVRARAQKCTFTATAAGTIAGARASTQITGVGECSYSPETTKKASSTGSAH
jgi:hypothetical protein